LIKSLKELGVSTSSNNGCLPVIIKGGTLKGGLTRIRGNVSSQFISALLLISPYAKRDVEIQVEGELVSKDYVDMTIETMWEFNVCVERIGYKKFKIKSGQRYLAREFVVTGDWTTANYFFAAAAICNGSIRVNGLNTKQNRGESKFLDALVEMGCMSRRNTNWAEIIGLRRLSGIEIDMSTIPDSVQTLAAVASLADGTTRITNIAHLKNKESNRIKDTVKELKKIGVLATSTDDTITIKGSTLKRAEIDPHNDHRMAMSLALIGLKTPGIRIANPECVNKSFPGFWDKLKEIGVETKNV
jgi:3-phosphoshikimate 1-carboxyvinyltransferase